MYRKVSVCPPTIQRYLNRINAFQKEDLQVLYNNLPFFADLFSSLNEDELELFETLLGFSYSPEAENKSKPTVSEIVRQLSQSFCDQYKIDENLRPKQADIKIFRGMVLSLLTKVWFTTFKVIIKQKREIKPPTTHPLFPLFETLSRGSVDIDRIVECVGCKKIFWKAQTSSKTCGNRKCVERRKYLVRIGKLQTVLNPTKNRALHIKLKPEIEKN